MCSYGDCSYLSVCRTVRGTILEIVMKLKNGKRRIPYIIMRKKLKGIKIDEIEETVCKTINKTEKIVREMPNAQIN